MWRFHRHIAYLVLAFVTGQDACDGSGAPGVAGPTAGLQDLDGPLPGDGRAKPPPASASVSGKVANWTPCLANSRIFLTTFSAVPCRLYSTGLICTAAALTIVLTVFSFHVETVELLA
jgi:hypothetical protein